MNTIYEFSDEMMKANNTLKEARDKFSELVEVESRLQGLTERHRQRWIERVNGLERSSPLMVKGNVVETPVETDGNTATIETLEHSTTIGSLTIEGPKIDLGNCHEPEPLPDPSLMKWPDLVQYAISKGHKTHGMTRRKLEALLV